MNQQRGQHWTADKFLLGIVAGAVALVLVGILVVVFGARPASPADLNTPAGTTQAYVEAIAAGDAEKAWGLLSASARPSAGLTEYRRRFPSARVAEDSDRRVVLTLASETADSAEVRVTISRFSSRIDPFSRSTFHREETVRLVREDGAWRIRQPAEPYSLAY
ncbi:MAG: hypothetical protein U0821_20660 [Chloroflexota bacterium]